MCLEVLEHVDNVEKTIEKISKLMNPDGTLILSTINRNLKSLIFAKIFGEYVLNWIPIGTHQFEKFLKPKEIAELLKLKKIKIKKMIREILFVPPSMNVLDLILKMRISHTHMAIVIDEHGGVDGLVTIEDLVEEIVGEIKDEHDAQKEKKKEIHSEIEEGLIIISARMQIKQFEKKYGKILFNKKDFKNIDTMGGLVFTLSGRIPLKGEIIKHSTGCEFEILEADTRRIRKILVRNHRML